MRGLEVGQTKVANWGNSDGVQFLTDVTAELSLHFLFQEVSPVLDFQHQNKEARENIYISNSLGALNNS